MPFYIPPIKDVVQRARNAFRAETPGTDAWIWPNNIYVSAKVIGGAVWEIFGRLKWMDRQRFAMTATDYELERHGLDYGIGRKPSSYAQGNLIVTADTWPLTIAANTTFTRTDGVTFKSTVPVDVSQFSLVATVPVVASAAGRGGNTIYGTPLAVSLGGVTAAAVDDVGLGQGSDEETDEQLRVRVLHRKRYPPNGGAEADYVGWGLELPGVTRVFVKGNAFGKGTVGVWFLMDTTYVAGIPLQADVDAAQAYLDDVAPVTANVIVQAPIADCLDIVVNKLSPDTQPIREAIAAELQTLINKMGRVSVPGDQFTLNLNDVWQAVGNASGQKHFQVAAPTTDIDFAVGTVPCLRSVTFTQT